MTQQAKNKNNTKSTSAKRPAKTAQPTIKSAVAEVETGAKHLAQAVTAEVKAVKAEVQSRAGEAVEQLKDTFNRTEERAERMLEKIPSVGPDAAQKLHDAVGHEPQRKASGSQGR